MTSIPNCPALFHRTSLTSSSKTTPKSLHNCSKKQKKEVSNAPRSPPTPKGAPGPHRGRGGGGVGEDFDLVSGVPMDSKNHTIHRNGLPRAHFLPYRKVSTKSTPKLDLPNLDFDAPVQARAPIALFHPGLKKHPNGTPKTSFGGARETQI